jgi:antitoxin HicB
MTREEGVEYAIVIEPLPAEDGGGFLARVPELPGCYSDGETPGQALASAKGAIREWLEETRRLGREPPALKSYSLAG